MSLLGCSVEEYVSGCIQLATLLEVSAYPKPGNVHRTADFDDTKYEHFLTSSLAIGQALRKGSSLGAKVASGTIEFKHVRIGEIISDAVSAMITWQHGGNTLLGSILLLIPIAVAAGYVWSQDSPSIEKLRNTISKVTHSTTPDDAVSVYHAIRISKAGGLGSVKRFDVTDEKSIVDMLNSGTSLLDVFKLSSNHDSISSEWANDFKITFDIGYPFFISEIKKVHEWNTAIVHLFLKILSTIPDSLIARKLGTNTAQDISKSAEQVLSIGGLKSKAGIFELERMDNNLRNNKHKINPGTTADLTSSSIAVAILEGCRP